MSNQYSSRASPNHTHSQGSVHLAFGSSRELGSLHTNNRLLAVHLDLALRVLIQSLLDQRLDEFDQVVVERISEHGMGDDSHVLEVG